MVPFRRFFDAIFPERSSAILQRLEEAYNGKSTAKLDQAMRAGAYSGFKPEHVPLLIKLFYEPWHYYHEDIVAALDQLREPRALKLFFDATQFLPEYMDYDIDNRAMARKAIWGLANLGTLEAVEILKQLAQSDVSAIKEMSLRRLAKILPT